MKNDDIADQEAIEGIIRGFKAKTKVKDTSQEGRANKIKSILLDFAIAKFSF